MEGTLINVKEAATQLDLTPQQVRNLCRENKIESEKLGSAWLLKEENVTYYKAKNSCGKTDNKHYTNLKEDSELGFERPVFLSFFSGAMGLDIGLEKCGFKPLLACEVDKASRKTIAKNKPDIALIGNIEEFTASDIRSHAGLDENQDIDLVVGGPPCQAFSTAGKRKGFNDSRGNLLLTFTEKIIDLKPRYAVIENVRGVLSAPLKHRPHNERGENFAPLNPDELKGGALKHIIDLLEKNGYGVSFNLYNSANFGVPQKRERVIIIAAKNGDKLPYLTPTHSNNEEFGLPKWQNFGEAVQNLPYTNLHHLNFPEKRLKYYRMLGPGEYWKNLPLDIQKEAMGKSFYSGGGKTGFLRRLDWHKPSPTLVTHPAMPATDLAHPNENRPLSIEEYKRIQQFPDEWQIEGSLVQQYKQVGNAVPVGLGKAVGKLLMNHIMEEPIVAYENFKYSRYRNTNDKTWKPQKTEKSKQYNLSI